MKEIDPQEAHTLLGENQGYVYLDVRSKPEFVAGRPAGAVHVPLLDQDGSGRMVPNPNFLEQVQKLLALDTKIICGCKSGGRSARAAEVMLQNGYTEVINMRGGFGGARDPQTGEVLEKGWSELGLPSEKG